MIAQDKMEKDRVDAKNTLEEYVYEMRDKLYASLEKFIREQVCYLAVVIFSNKCTIQTSR